MFDREIATALLGGILGTGKYQSAPSRLLPPWQGSLRRSNYFPGKLANYFGPLEFPCKKLLSIGKHLYWSVPECFISRQLKQLLKTADQNKVGSYAATRASQALAIARPGEIEDTISFEVCQWFGRAAG